MSSVVLDASALIAFLREEPGSNIVRRSLPLAAISAVNLAEVLAKASESSRRYNDVKSAIRALNLRVVPFDHEQSEISAGLRPLTRDLGLSLGDRCCLALGLTLESPVLTTDREWEKLPGGFQVRVIR